MVVTGLTPMTMPRYLFFCCFTVLSGATGLDLCSRVHEQRYTNGLTTRIVVRSCLLFLSLLSFFRVVVAFIGNDRYNVPRIYTAVVRTTTAAAVVNSRYPDPTAVRKG